MDDDVMLGRCDDPSPVPPDRWQHEGGGSPSVTTPQEPDITWVEQRAGLGQREAQPFE
ncbi:hypothetical protein ACIBQ6_48510 [Nonomuraea sp. NPDC049655]|uniref:hypothetical protein n=1 Tax=Nonomuraea sp. NPDC049655 TaxID=3364355 RepID=UPI0037BB6627